MKCKACNRDAGRRDFCQVHLKAYANIIETYDSWRKALKISWREYLSEIKGNPLTGEWAREVASYLINHEGIRNVEKS